MQPKFNQTRWSMPKKIRPKKNFGNFFFDPHFFFTQTYFFGQHFFWPNFFSANIIFDPNFFSDKIFLTQIFFRKTKFRCKLFGIQDLGFGIQDLGLGIWELNSSWPTGHSDQLGVAQLSQIFFQKKKLDPKNVGFRILDLGFRILGFGS